MSMHGFCEERRVMRKVYYDSVLWLAAYISIVYNKVRE